MDCVGWYGGCERGGLVIRFVRLGGCGGRMSAVVRSVMCAWQFRGWSGVSSGCGAVLSQLS